MRALCKGCIKFFLCYSKNLNISTGNAICLRIIHKILPMKPFLTLLLLLATLLCFSQKNFRAGYMVTTAGDTIKGNIKYTNWETNPRKIEFLQDGKQPASFGLNDLIAFEITDEDRYEKYIVLKSGRPTDINRFNENIPKSPVIDTVFLRVLVKGLVSLYELVDKRNYYFISNAYGDPKELEHWLEPKAQSLDFYKRDTYKDQLRELMNGLAFDKKINNRINNLTYIENSLTNIVNQINLLKGSAVNIWKPVKKNNTYLFVGSGVNIGKMNFSGTSPEFSTLNYSTSVTPSFRAGVDYASSRNLQRLIFRPELAYHSLKFSGTSIIDKGSVFERNVDYDIQLKMISPTIHLLYIISQSRTDIYLGLGMNWNFTSNTNRHVSNYKNGQQIIRDPFVDVEKKWLSVNSKVGVMISKKFDFNINYKLAGGFVNYSNFTGGANVIGLELNYRFQHSR